MNQKTGGLTKDQFQKEVIRVRPGSANYEAQLKELMQARKLGKENGLK